MGQLRLSSLLIFFALTLSCIGFSDAYKLHQADEPPAPVAIPWLTGPLLTPSGHVIPTGHLNVEPYLYASTTYGFFDKHWAPHSAPKFYTVQLQVPFQYGFANKFDFQFTPNAYWKHTDGASHWDFGDATFQIDYQLLNDTPGSWWPAIRLTAGVNIPFGKFQKLNASSKGTDIGGSGTWQPAASIVFSRLFTFNGPRYLATRFFFGYTPTVPVHVKGLNAYGGDEETRGKIYSGNTFTGLIGLEYTWTQRWALALDIDYSHSNKVRFTGRSTAAMGGPSSDQWSIAPAIEYNWSAYVGMIAGCWFSLGGRNASEFANGIIAINIYR
ncbi:MAG: hypothetical protein K2P51_03110 [Rhabdochlamydiaceae bacterium]|nr:hypothetical protein [Rhabdochlamydiaceae bacterium]